MNQLDKNFFDYKRMSNLFASAKMVPIMAFVQSTVYLYLSQGSSHYDSYFWWWVAYNIYTVFSCGYFTVRDFQFKKHGYKADTNYRHHELSWTFGMSIGFAVLWAIQQIFIFPEKPVHGLMLIFLLTGTISAMTIVHSISRISVISGATIHFIFLGYSMARCMESYSQGTGFEWLFVAGGCTMVFLTYVFALKSSKELYENQVENIRLVMERQQMVKELEETNEKVNTANANLLEAQKQVEAATRMAAIGEMSASVAHEINNPLAVVKSATEGVEIGLEMSEMGEPYKKDFELIYKNLSRIMGMVDSFKSFSDQTVAEEMADLDELNISQLTEKALESYSRKGIEYKLDIQPDLLTRLNESHFEQALAQILNNAFDAVGSSDEKFVSVKLTDVNGYIELSIEDSGAGVPADIRHKIFEPSFSTKSRKEGLGMGLSISQSLLSSMGARLYLEESSASKFVIEFKPVEEAKKAA